MHTTKDKLTTLTTALNVTASAAYLIGLVAGAIVLAAAVTRVLYHLPQWAFTGEW